MKRVTRLVTLGALLLAGAFSVRAQESADVEGIREQLVGSYRLVWYMSYDRESRESKLPYSVGQISYDRVGRISAQLMRDDRPRFALNRTTEAERAAAYSSFISYFGRYVIDAARRTVTHHVEGSLSPNMVGQSLVRHFEFSTDGRTLFLSVKDGDRVTGRLRWDRHQ